jgi:hypothetical protein
VIVTATRTTTLRPHISISIDSIADAAFVTQREARAAAELVCDACDIPLKGEPAGRGLLMWSRGDELRFEEPALCGRCAMAIGITALMTWSVDEEEEG